MTDKDLCRLSGLIYDDEPHGEVNEIEYGIYDSVIAIRGTEAGKLSGWADVLRDMWVWPKYHPVLGHGHAGFQRGALGLYDELVRLPKEVEWILTGHSLGAAIAMFLAHLMCAAGYKVRFVGFGCPKAYIGSRVLDFEARSYIYGRDIVTQIPYGVLVPFRHPKNLELIKIGKPTSCIGDHSITDSYGRYFNVESN